MSDSNGDDDDNDDGIKNEKRRKKLEVTVNKGAILPASQIISGDRQ